MWGLRGVAAGLVIAASAMAQPALAQRTGARFVDPPEGRAQAGAHDGPEDARRADGDPARESEPLRTRLERVSRRGEVPRETVRSIAYLLDVAERRDERRRRRDVPWLERAARYLALAEAGRDPYAEARGEITLRAYRSPVSLDRQGYAVYVPPDYDPAREYPLLVALHGGSSNGNLFLALTLGVTVPWADYRDHFFTPHAPVATPDWIVVAPNGFGNSMWRFMGERDVLDVIGDVMRSYRVDPDRVVLHGLSNGGLGSYNVGTRHAWRFSAVVPLAGAPGWLHYLGGHPDDLHLRALRPLSAWPLIENARNTHLHAHHGRSDPGPMRPAYVDALSAHVTEARVPFALDWYATGHDLVGPVHRHGGVFEREAERRRDPMPAEVTLVTGDYRANRQHWVAVTRIAGYPSLARVHARVSGGAVGGGVVSVRTERARAIELDLDSAPLADGPLALRIDATTIALGSRRGMVSLVRAESGWRIGAPRGDELGKRPGLSGPIPDAYWESLVHVYGTQVPAHARILRDAAERGARGFVPNTSGIRQRVLADREVSPELAASSHLVLYGSPGDNTVLDSILDRLPLRIERDAITVGGARHAGRHVGTRLVYPSPLARDRYVIVQAGARAQAVLAGDRLPAFLPDYVVYDARRLPAERGNLPRAPYLAAGFFDDRWQLP